MYLHEMTGNLLKDIVEIILKNECTGENLESALNSKVEEVFECIGIAGWKTSGSHTIMLEKNEHIFYVYPDEGWGYRMEVNALTACGNLYSDNFMHLVEIANQIAEIDYSVRR